MLDIKTIKQQAQGRWLEIIPALDSRFQNAIDKLPNGVPCPIGTGKKDGFNFVNRSALDGHAFTNSGESLGSGFDVLMWANGWDFREVLERVNDYLGNPETTRHTNQEKTPSQNPTATKNNDNIEEPYINPYPLRIWDESSDTISETVKQYLINRGLGEVTNSPLPISLRCHKNLEYREDKKIIGIYPALIGEITRNGELAGIQRQYLDSEGNKAEVITQKSMVRQTEGGLSGGAVHLGEPTNTLAITEGIENGLAVQLATSIPTWATGVAIMLSKVEIPETVKTVYIFADKDKSGTGERVAEKLKKRLKEQGKEVYILMPPMPRPQEAKSIDWLDVLNQQGKTPFNDAIKNTKKMQNKANNDIKKNLSQKIQEINKSYAWVSVGGKSRMMQWKYDYDLKKSLPHYIEKTTFLDGFANQKIAVGETESGKLRYKTVGNAWFEHSERASYIEGVYFEPMKSQLENGTYQKYPNRLNLWTGFSIEPKPCAGTEIQPIINHLYKTVCEGNIEYYEYLINWIAWVLQNPEKTAEVCVVLRGEKGTGKGVIGRLINDIFGRHGMHLTSSRQLIGQFNAHLAECTYIFSDEATYAGDKQGESTLKALVTEPTISIERKGLDIEKAINRLSILMATNSDWVVNSSKDERRWFVLNVDKKQSSEYYKILNTACKSQDTQAYFLDYCLNLDLKNFHPRTYPETEANKEQRIQSL